ncbi:MAG: DUF63 family protein [Candidatus Nanoarchaeia archaeon]|nr:DUF63 family protein [Candidatus Nanoarchaeia archaeon]MDD5239754.1 DUF63 family protein [Candidatus Nanoarchaeia archaeon]
MVEGYSLLSTIVLGIVAVCGTYLLYHIFKKLNLSLDKYFVYGIVPWIVFAAFVRVYEDAGIYPTTFFTQTPGIEILFVVLIIPFMFLAKFLEKKYNFAFWKTMAVSGTIGALVHVPFFKIVNPKGFLLIFIFFAIAIGLIGAVRHFIRFDLLSFWALAAHMIDASATFVSMTFFGYGEQHILPTFLINTFGGAWVMFPLKLIVLVPVLYILNKYTKEDKLLKNTIILAIIALGLAAGLRDALRLLMGV